MAALLFQSLKAINTTLDKFLKGWESIPCSNILASLRNCARDTFPSLLPTNKQCINREALNIMVHCYWQTYSFDGDSIDILNLFKEEPFAFFLDSSLQNETTGRFSFIGFDPFDIFNGKGNNAFPLLKNIFSQYKEDKEDSPSPLSSGIVGYFSYELGACWENIVSRKKTDSLSPDCFFCFYDCVITIDHLTRKLYVSSTGLPEQDSYLRKKRAKRRLERITSRIEDYLLYGRSTPNNIDHLFYDSKRELDFQCNFTKQAYLHAVDKALAYIRCGDIYQVNLSQRFLINARAYVDELRPIEMYKSLRRLSPTSWGGYLDCGRFQVLSNSPERFLKVHQNNVETRPMKGTRPRGKNTQEDQLLSQALMDSEKDKAELLMITDLKRNDLGRVCEYGSIKVEEMRRLEKYKTVFQTTSTINGVLQENKDCFDVIRACFPGGSITGCPKIRSMEIIEELEPTPRALYTGSLGYMNFSGGMDFNILIRTLFVQGEKIYFHVGGGIVADSVPEDEYNETLVKAQALRLCLADILHKKKESICI